MSARLPDRGVIPARPAEQSPGGAVAVGLAEAGADVALVYHTHDGNEVV